MSVGRGGLACLCQTHVIMSNTRLNRSRHREGALIVRVSHSTPKDDCAA